jgi:hypothetical protein
MPPHPRSPAPCLFDFCLGAGVVGSIDLIGADPARASGRPAVSFDLVV